MGRQQWVRDRSRFWRFRLGVVVATAGVAALVLYVSGALAARTATTATPGVTAKTVLLGMENCYSGGFSSSFGLQSTAAALARIRLQNAAGGVHGRKIKLVVVDDQSSFQQAQTAAQTLIQQDKVFAVLPTCPAAQAAINIYLQSGVPIVMGFPGNLAIPQNPTVFSYSGNANPHFPAFRGPIRYFQTLKAKKVCAAAYGVSTVGVDGTKAIVNGLHSVGISTPVVDLAVAAGQVDFSADVLKMQQAGCDAVYTSMATQSNLALATALRQAGVKLKGTYILAGYSQAVLDTAASRAAAEGLEFTSYFSPPQVNTPATRRFMKALRKYGGLRTPNPYENSYWGWAGADLAITGLERAGRNLTWASFIKALRSDHHYTLGGLYGGSIDMSKYFYYDSNATANCIYVAKVVHGKFVMYRKKPFCGASIPGTDAVP
jgi:branched-chain amino acid transport system substrate-binding protein